MCDLSNPIYHDADKAREHLEAIRWPNGPICPHCGVIGNAAELKGKAHRPGVCKCRDCRKQFSVTVGTVFERSKVPLNKWLLAVHLMTSSKKGISSHQIHRSLGVTYKTTWFMTHRIRHSMETTDATPFGQGGGTVEIDETYIGRKKGVPKAKAAHHHKQAVFTLVERGGKARSFRVSGSMFDTMKEALKRASPDAHVKSDTARIYLNIGKRFASHEMVNHSIKEWKRGMKGVYQDCSEEHLHR